MNRPPEPGRSRRRRLVVAGAATLVTAALVTALVLRDTGPSAAHTGVDRSTPAVTQAVDRGDIVHTISASGTLNPVNQVLVGTQASGRIARLHADFNTVVTRGQLLGEIDTSTLEADLAASVAQLDGARASLRLAEAELARTVGLAEEGFITQSELEQTVQRRDSARATVAQQTAALRRTRTALDYAQIRSPVAGTVVSRDVSVGQTVQSAFSTPTLFRIAEDLRSMRIEAAVSEADIGQVTEGMPVEYTVDAYPDRRFGGVVRQVRNNYAIQQNVVTYTVVIDTGNEDLALRPGMTAYVNVEIARRSGVLRIPNAALRHAVQSTAGRPLPPAGVRRVWRQPAEGPATLLEVRVGISDGRFTEALDGTLAPGDPLVIGVPPGDGGLPVPKLF